MDAHLSDNSTLARKEIGSLFGAILTERGARVGGFGDDFQAVQMHVGAPVLQRQDALLGIDQEVGNSTNGWKVLRDLRKEEIVVEFIEHTEEHEEVTDEITTFDPF
jgi:hypothetical protein